MSLDIILGPMFAGKTSRIFSIVSRYTALGMRVLVVKHANDVRYGNNEEIVTHDGRRIPCRAVRDLFDIGLNQYLQYDLIVVDEAQFFQGLVPFVESIVDTHEKHLFLVGLDGDSNRRPFGEILQCIPLADRVERIAGLCRRCADGTPGVFSWRHAGPNDRQVAVGGENWYEALCRSCYLQMIRGPVQD
jgi:thymidine kinase